mmetsp:Transcript_30774/g.51790  ORF Transcript_30774/g.51790 Transcript_30774/m.51790 type:complete len:219 (+) Transcript_30774:246-902(+)
MLLHLGPSRYACSVGTNTAKYSISSAVAAMRSRMPLSRCTSTGPDSTFWYSRLELMPASRLKSGPATHAATAMRGLRRATDTFAARSAVEAPQASNVAPRKAGGTPATMPTTSSSSTRVPADSFIHRMACTKVTMGMSHAPVTSSTLLALYIAAERITMLKKMKKKREWSPVESPMDTRKKKDPHTLITAPYTRPGSSGVIVSESVTFTGTVTGEHIF